MTPLRITVSGRQHVVPRDVVEGAGGVDLDLPAALRHQVLGQLPGGGLGSPHDLDAVAGRDEGDLHRRRRRTGGCAAVRRCHGGGPSRGSRDRRRPRRPWRRGRDRRGLGAHVRGSVGPRRRHVGLRPARRRPPSSPGSASGRAATPPGARQRTAPSRSLSSLDVSGALDDSRQHDRRPASPTPRRRRARPTSSTRRSRASSSWVRHRGGGDRRRRRRHRGPPSARTSHPSPHAACRTRPPAAGQRVGDRRHPPRVGVVGPGNLDGDRRRHRQRVHLAAQVGHLGVEHVQGAADGGGELAHLVGHVAEVPEAQRPQAALDRRASGTTRLDRYDGVDEDRGVDEPEHVAQRGAPAPERGVGQEQLVELALDVGRQIARGPAPPDLVVDLVAYLRRGIAGPRRRRGRADGPDSPGSSVNTSPPRGSEAYAPPVTAGAPGLVPVSVRRCGTDS